MACAQCHDHKYDPITQRDYYSLLDAFNRVPESGTPQFFSSRIRVAAPFIELPTEENKAALAEFEPRSPRPKAERQNRGRGGLRGLAGGRVCQHARSAAGIGLPLLQQARDRTHAQTNRRRSMPDLRQALRREGAAEACRQAAVDEGRQPSQEAAGRRIERDKLPRVMVMSDAQPRETTILDRGEYLKPTEKVSFATPAFLPPLPAGARPIAWGSPGGWCRPSIR